MTKCAKMIVVAVCGFACGAGHEESAAEGLSVGEYMGAGQSDYEPLTGQQLTSASDLIIRGHIESVSEGRIADLAHEDLSIPMPTLIYRVRVGTMIKGTAQEFAYLERYKELYSADEISPSLPQDEVMLFLGPPSFNPDVYKFDYPDRGRPPGEPLWELLTPQAMLLESDGVAHQVLAPEDTVRAFTSSSLDGVEAEVRTIMEQ